MSIDNERGFRFFADKINSMLEREFERELEVQLQSLERVTKIMKMLITYGMNSETYTDVIEAEHIIVKISSLGEGMVTVKNGTLTSGQFGQPEPFVSVQYSQVYRIVRHVQ